VATKRVKKRVEEEERDNSMIKKEDEERDDVNLISPDHHIEMK